MSAIIFSGAAQILASQMLAAGAPVAVVVLTCAVLGLRFLMYSAAMAPALSRCRRAGNGRSRSCSPTRPSPRRSASSIAAATRAAARCISLGGGTALWGSWQIDNVVGYFAGNVIPASWSLEFTVPLAFSRCSRRAQERAAGHCGRGRRRRGVALEALPMRLNLVAAGVLGIVAGTLVEIVRERWKAR